jgi:hypothetical protein
MFLDGLVVAFLACKRVGQVGVREELCIVESDGLAAKRSETPFVSGLCGLCVLCVSLVFTRFP